MHSSTVHSSTVHSSTVHSSTVHSSTVHSSTVHIAQNNKENMSQKQNTQNGAYIEIGIHNLTIKIHSNNNTQFRNLIQTYKTYNRKKNDTQ